MKIDEEKSIGELAWEIAERTDTASVLWRRDKWYEETDEVERELNKCRLRRRLIVGPGRVIDELADVLITTLSFAQALGEPNLMERAREKALKVLAGLE